MKVIIICFLFFSLFAFPVDAKRRNIEDFFKRREEVIQAMPTPVVHPTSIPSPTPKPLMLLPNDSEVQSYLQEATDDASTLSAITTSSPSLAPNPPKSKPQHQPDQTVGIIASFLAFAGVTMASYQGVFDRGIFKKL